MYNYTVGKFTALSRNEVFVNLKNMLDQNALSKRKDQIKNVFFYRVCGTGMGAAACLLKETGINVEGGDTNYFPPMSSYLESTGIKLHDLNDFDHSVLADFDLVVVGNVVPRLSDEARAIEECGVPFCSFPSLLGSLVLKDMNVTGVAGTHGKTTTTYFLSQIFEKLGEDCGYFIGGVLEGRPSSKLGAGKYFFIESDEYDSCYFEKFSKFRSYSIDNLILTSLEFDHADIFDDLEAIKNEFRVILKEPKKVVIANNEYPSIEDLQSECSSLEWLLYGPKSQNGPKIIEQSEAGTLFELSFKEQTIEFKTNIIGPHNILNLSSCILYALNEGFSEVNIKNAVSELSFVKRRQEVRGTYQDCLVIDDFAHHPRSVACTVEATKMRFPDKEIIVILEPNSATARSNIFQEEFFDALKESSHVIFAKPLRDTSVKSAKNLDYKLLVEGLGHSNINAQLCENLNGLRSAINNLANKQRVLLILSNGTCLGLWKSDFVKSLKKVDS